jgi:uncharacterized iron-regulated membrane protein
MATPTTLAPRMSLFWRIHFWAALIASPFTLLATLTGLLYVFTPQIEGVLHSHLDTVVAQGQRLPLDAAIAAAQAAAPAGATLKSVVPAYQPQDSVQVYFKAQNAGTRTSMPAADAGGEHSGHQHGAAPAAVTDAGSSKRPAVAGASMDHNPSDRIPIGTIVYVNPYNAQVLGSLLEIDRFGMWSKRLHSSLLQPDSWRWMIELAASWLMVMLLTGMYLWWPRGNKKALPQAGVTGRNAWRQWHAFVGVALAAMSLAILTTGLTWSKYSGAQIRGAMDAAGQASPKAPKDLKSTPLAGRTPLNWEAAWQTSAKQSPDVSMQLTPPRGPQGTWRANNFDRGQPDKRFNLQLDAYNGKTLYYSGWDDLAVFGKATAIGIPFHRGEFGWWNQALLIVFGVGVLFSLVSGWAMFFKRRRAGLLGLPPLKHGAWASMPVMGWVSAAIFFVLMPLLAYSAAVVALIEAGMAWQARRGAIENAN